MAIKNKKVFIRGKQLKCLICEGTHFTIRRTLLNTRMMTFLHFEEKDSEVINYICEKCGHILWFMEKPSHDFEDFSDEEQSEVDEFDVNYEKSIANENECPNCFSVINKDDFECGNCGYTLK